MSNPPQGSLEMYCKFKALKWYFHLVNTIPDSEILLKQGSYHILLKYYGNQLQARPLSKMHIKKNCALDFTLMSRSVLLLCYDLQNIGRMVKFWTIKWKIKIYNRTYLQTFTLQQKLKIAEFLWKWSAGSLLLKTTSWNRCHGTARSFTLFLYFRWSGIYLFECAVATAFRCSFL